MRCELHAHIYSQSRNHQHLLLMNLRAGNRMHLGQRLFFFCCAMTLIRGLKMASSGSSAFLPSTTVCVFINPSPIYFRKAFLSTFYTVFSSFSTYLTFRLFWLSQVCDLCLLQWLWLWLGLELLVVLNIYLLAI